MHMMRCNKAGKLRVNTHDRMAECLRDIAKSSGRVADFYSHGEKDPDSVDAEPDIVVDGNLLIDVSYTTSDPQIYLRPRSQIKDKAAAAYNREQKKISRYAVETKVTNCKFEPFVIERNTGAMADRSVALLQSLSKSPDGKSVIPLAFAKALIAATLVRSNTYFVNITAAKNRTIEFLGTHRGRRVLSRAS
jgi:hypothetical protein